MDGPWSHLGTLTPTFTQGTWCHRWHGQSHIQICTSSTPRYVIFFRMTLLHQALCSLYTHCPFLKKLYLRIYIFLLLDKNKCYFVQVPYGRLVLYKEHMSSMHQSSPSRHNLTGVFVMCIVHTYSWRHFWHLFSWFLSWIPSLFLSLALANWLWHQQGFGALGQCVGSRCCTTHSQASRGWVRGDYIEDVWVQWYQVKDHVST